MPKLSTKNKTSVTTIAEVQLSPKLKTKLETLVARLQKRAKEISALESQQDEDKETIETEMAEAGEYNTLLAGIRINDIPVKRVEGQTHDVLDKEGLMRRFKITPAVWDSFIEKKPKKGHLSISLPRKKKED